MTIRIKVPARILEQIPRAGNRRSRFILQAIEEKLARKKAVPWKPGTARGRRLAALLRKGEAERGADLSIEQLEAELRERRGGIAW